jgi:tetratricopeptide (TPR) repeat protein
MLKHVRLRMTAHSIPAVSYEVIAHVDRTSASHMNDRTWLANTSLILAIGLLLTTGASAQTSQEWIQCTGREGPIADVVIAGCTAIIQAAQEPAAKLATAFNNRGVAYRLKGKYDQALEDFDQSIRLNPSSPKHYNNRGIIYRIRHDYDRAIADYNEAIWLKSDFPAAFYNRAVAYFDQGEYERALADLEVVLRFDKRNALALYARGMILLKKGDDAGEADITAAKAINPDIAKQFDTSR